MPVGSVTLEQPSRGQIYETTANGVTYSCDADLPDNVYESREHYNSQRIYSDLIYKWSFSDGRTLTSTSGSGTHDFSQLSQGAENTIEVSVEVFCTEVFSEQKEEDHGGDVSTGKFDENGNEIFVYEEDWVWGDWVEVSRNTEFSVGGGSDSKIIYTHPGPCIVFSSLSFNDIIGKTLTSGMVSDWCTHCGQWLSWYNQLYCYSDADGCNINSGDLITASWFNGCVSTAESDDPLVVGGPKGTLISASLFHKLDDLVSRRD